MKSKSYIAGLFDGEGCIAIAVYRRKKPYHVMKVEIGLYGAEHIFKELKQKFGGHIIFKGVKRDCPYYRVRCQKAIEFLRYIADEVEIKKRQIKLAFEYYDEMPEFQILTREEIMRRESIREKIHVLNGKNMRNYKPLTEVEMNV